MNTILFWFLAPASVTTLTNTSKTDGSIYLTWSEPGNTGGLDVSLYKVNIKVLISHQMLLLWRLTLTHCLSRPFWTLPLPSLSRFDVTDVNPVNFLSKEFQWSRNLDMYIRTESCQIPPREALSSTSSFLCFDHSIGISYYIVINPMLSVYALNLMSIRWNSKLETNTSIVLYVMHCLVSWSDFFLQTEKCCNTSINLWPTWYKTTQLGWSYVNYYCIAIRPKLTLSNSEEYVTPLRCYILRVTTLSIVHTIYIAPLWPLVVIQLNIVFLWFL